MKQYAVIYTSPVAYGGHTVQFMNIETDGDPFKEAERLGVDPYAICFIIDGGLQMVEPTSAETQPEETSP